MDFLIDPQIKIILELCLATFLGSLVGLEREYKRKEAGLRTYALVCLGSALFTIISFNGFGAYQGEQGISFDPSRIIGQVVLGIGFIGAGLIVYRQTHIEGLTTAAGLWVAAAIGVSVGVGFYLIAVFAAFLAIGILAGLRLIEEKIIKIGD